MEETHNYGEWFFGSDRVAIFGLLGDTTSHLFAFPLPHKIAEGEEITLEKLNDDGWSASDFRSLCLSADLGDITTGGVAVCDIPDNCALYLTDNEAGDAPDGEYEPFVVHWSKR